VDRLAAADPEAGKQSRYMLRTCYHPPAEHTQVRYLPLGEDNFVCLMEELEKAEHYIFLEYFIIREGIMWDAILEVLERKAKAGVDVRLLYDDIGCLFCLPNHYDRVIRSKGIACQVFNPFSPTISIHLNNRDHRKMCIIDGHTGFTGGWNLSDEYINKWERFGHWKDNGVMLKGDAVWSLTVMFLSAWAFESGKDEDFEAYRPQQHMTSLPQTQGMVQPYCTSPLQREAVGAAVYRNLINQAKKTVYITTPYLIIDYSMTEALTVAARSGVDVRIITPHIPDKRYVFELTRAHYAPLLEAGIRIFEYTPGFIHAKTMVVDNRYAVVGTVNLDYRSMYLHFENGVWMYDVPAVQDITADFLATQEISQEVFLEQTQRLGWLKRFGRALLRLISPLL
jgi:cardiolipin synthase